jgi:hypothetical protein
VTLDETEEVINVLRLTREADAAAVLKELEDGTWMGCVDGVDPRRLWPVGRKSP